MDKVRILIVEDELIVAEDLKEVIEGLGYQVVGIADTGEKAIAQALELKPDLMLSDIRLHGEMTGIEAAQQIVAQLDLPVVFLSAFADEDTLAKVKEINPYGYLLKPFKEQELRTTIEVVLHKHDIELEMRSLQRQLQRKVEELEQSQVQIRKLSRVVEQSPVSVLMTDTEGVIEYVNDCFSVITGYTREEVIGENPRILQSGYHVERFYEELWATIKAGGQWRGEFCNRRKNGEVYWVAASISPVRNNRGEVTHFVAIEVDITQEKMIANRERAQQLVRAAVWGMGKPEDIKDVLSAFGHALNQIQIRYLAYGINVVEEEGESREVHSYTSTIEGENWSKMVDENGRNIIVQMWQAGDVSYRSDLASEDLYGEREVLEGGFGVVRSVVDVPFSRGTIAVNSREKDAFSDRQIADLKGLAQVLDEGFHRVEDLENLERTRGQLYQAQKMEAIGQLAGGVAHDFNNMISVVSGYCQLLSKDLDRESNLYLCLKEIDDSASKASNLVRQLLVFSRRQAMQPQLLDLNQIVADMDRMLGRLIGEDAQMETRLEQPLRKVSADPSQIEQVIVNLVVNARDAMPGGGQLTIETSNQNLDASYCRNYSGLDAGNYVMIAVSDTGIGMSAETLEHIFEPFFTTKEEGKGTGLGLATVYGIVKQSHGHIHAYSEENVGTTFKVYLPIAEEVENIEITAVNGKEERAIGGSESILIVEDDDTVLRLVHTILVDTGYEVAAVQDVNEALSLAEGDRHFDLLLTDVVMPVMNGVDLSERLCQLRPGLKVIYMSGYADQGFQRRGLIDPDTNFLSKPFTPDELLHKVREGLDK